VKVQALLAPLLSAARHVTAVVPRGKVEPLTKPVKRYTAFTPQLSVAVGLAYTTGVLQALTGLFCVMFIAQVTTGGWLSVTVMLNVQVEERPAPSMARHTTVVVPGAKAEPLAGPPMRVTVGAGAQLSVAVGGRVGHRR